MSRVGWVLLTVTVLFAAAGVTVLLLPFDTTYAVPSVAGQPATEVDLHCKAPLVDTFTSDPEEQWIDYAPDRGVSLESGGRTGGEGCASSSSARGVVGMSLLLVATMSAAAAALFGRRRPAPGEPAELPDDPITTVAGQPEAPPGPASSA